MYECKMLTICTSHLSKETAHWLDYSVWDGPLVIYAKGDYGWFVYVPEDDDIYKETTEHLFDDIKACMDLAKDKGCAWLCFDRDYDEADDLPTYNW